LKKIDMKATGENIKNICEKVELAPKDISRLFNIDLSTVYYWFQGKVLPRFDIAYNLADMCNCKIDDFIVPEEEEEDGENND